MERSLWRERRWMREQRLRRKQGCRKEWEGGSRGDGGSTASGSGVSKNEEKEKCVKTKEEKGGWGGGDFYITYHVVYLILVIIHSATGLSSLWWQAITGTKNGLIVDWTPRRKYHWNLNQNTKAFLSVKCHTCWLLCLFVISWSHSETIRRHASGSTSAEVMA